MYQFNNEKREITIKKSNPPTPWMNYLSNGTFHTMMSQAGGGVAFYKSPQIWRINHYRFFHLPTDRSGFYAYIKDGDSVWCPTAEPTKDRPEKWQATHGMGYTRFEAERKGLSVTATYFVGKYENCLIWNLKFKSDTDRKIKLFPYVELGMMEFMRELQWQCYSKHQLECYNMDDILVYEYGVEDQPKPDETPLVYFAANQKVSGFDCDRDEFIGGYRSEENPQRVEQGKCTNSTMFGGDPCFALEIEVDLKAGEEKVVNIFLGTAMTEEDIKKSVDHCREADFVDKSFAGLKEHWNEHLSKFQAELPDKDAETMVNIWNPYQAERNFQFSRNISYYATGTFRGFGVRDTAQDILSMIPFDLRRAKNQLNLLLTQQYNDGHSNHYFFPNEGWEPVTGIRSDNHLWFIMTAYNIVMEEGSLDYLDEVVTYYDGGEGTVWEHIKKSIDYTESQLGENGFPLMLASDWNDMLSRVCREGKGESIWTGMQFGTVLRQIAELARLKGEDDSKFNKLYADQKKRVNEIAWDGEWFIRCITDNGRFIGAEKESQAKIWLNSQSWSVLSGLGDEDKQIKAMDSVKKYLNTELGIKKIHPSMTNDYPNKEVPLSYEKPGCSENGSIFCHANTWAIIAECMLGRADRAYHYYHQLLPMIAQKKAGEWRYKAEPYVYSSNIFGPESDKFGLANVSWLSGTASWMYIAVTQYMLGIKPRFDGLEINSCLAEEMLPAKITREFRGVKYNITITQNKKVLVPFDDSKKEVDIVV
ncbi:MAG: hypothetical protein IJN99_00060 [Clostridia bacterium]|nr:hypothetical protein [Clostridia bacterium]